MAVLGTTLLAGCLDPVTLDLTARGDWTHWKDGSATARCDRGGTVIDVEVTNHEGQIHRLTRAHWRYEWDGGEAARPLVVEGPEEVTPDGTVEVRLYGCPSEGASAATRILLFDRDASEEFAHMLADVQL